MTWRDPVGPAEIADRLGVREATIRQWKWRGLMPPPRTTISGVPLWDWPVVERWAAKTGRLSGGTD